MFSEKISEFSLAAPEMAESCAPLAAERWQKLQHRLKMFSQHEPKMAHQYSSSRQSVLLFLGGSQVIELMREASMHTGGEDAFESMSVVLDEIENICLPKFILLYERFKFFTVSSSNRSCQCEVVQDLKGLSESCEFNVMTDKFIDTRVKELTVEMKSQCGRKMRNLTHDSGSICPSHSLCGNSNAKHQTVTTNSSKCANAGSCSDDSVHSIETEKSRRGKPRKKFLSSQQGKEVTIERRHIPMRLAKSAALQKSLHLQDSHSSSDQSDTDSDSLNEETEKGLKKFRLANTVSDNPPHSAPRVFVNILTRPGAVRGCSADPTVALRSHSRSDEETFTSSDEDTQGLDHGKDAKRKCVQSLDTAQAETTVQTQLYSPSRTASICPERNDTSSGADETLDREMHEPERSQQNTCSSNRKAKNSYENMCLSEFHEPVENQGISHTRHKVLCAPSDHLGNTNERDDSDLKFVHVTNLSASSVNSVQVSVSSDQSRVGSKTGLQPLLPSHIVEPAAASSPSRGTMLQCKMCNTLCAHRKILNVHMLTSHGITVPDDTDEPAETEKGLARSAVTTVSLLPLTCGQCGERFKYQSQLDMHEEEIHKKNACKCRVCLKQFLHLHALGRHFLTSHLDQVSLQAGESGFSMEKPSCRVCFKSFPHAHNLKRHFLRAHPDTFMLGDPGGVCSVCGKTFKSSSLLARHETMHSLPRVPCDICGAKFISEKKCNYHKEIRHGAKALQNPFICEVCGKAYRFRYLLRKHSSKHSSEKPFQCTQCSESFKEKKTLELHIKVHQGDPPFKCPTCLEAFIHKEPYLNHMRKHSGEKPFVCSQCGKGFRIQSALSTHMKTHNANRPRPYKCTLCSFTCEKRYLLVKHSLKHSGLKPHKCPVCDAGFTSPYGRNKHLKRTHGIKDPKTALLVGVKSSVSPPSHQFSAPVIVTSSHKLSVPLTLGTPSRKSASQKQAPVVARPTLSHKPAPAIGPPSHTPATVKGTPSHTPDVRTPSNAPVTVIGRPTPSHKPASIIGTSSHKSTTPVRIAASAEKVAATTSKSSSSMPGFASNFPASGLPVSSSTFETDMAVYQALQTLRNETPPLGQVALPPGPAPPTPRPAPVYTVSSHLQDGRNFDHI